jgi:serine/threonine protein kinase
LAEMYLRLAMPVRILTTLRSRYYERWSPTPVELLKVALDVCQGMRYLHTAFDKPIVHRDLKSPNILFVDPPSDAAGRPERLRVKITDFGLSRQKKEQVKASYKTQTMGGSPHHVHHKVHTDVMTKCGSTLWMAPEIYDASHFGPYNEKVDVFSFAMVLVELLDGKLPWINYGGSEQVSGERMRERTAVPRLPVWPHAVLAAPLAGAAHMRERHPPGRAAVSRPSQRPTERRL